MREPSSTYLKSGEFSPDGMLALIEDWSRATFSREDCRFARAAADMSWALPHVSNGFISDLVSHEARVAASEGTKCCQPSAPAALVGSTPLDAAGCG